LTVLKERIIADKKEKIVSFDGRVLTTNKRSFQLADGVLIEGTPK
jgi:hypothetical protein